MKKVLATLAAVAAGGTLVACGSAPESEIGRAHV